MTEQSIGELARGVVSGMRGETVWEQGTKISENGIYCGLPIEIYHTDCCAGPSISKSSLKHLIPAHGGSPKAFWGRWAYNPLRIEPSFSEALDFGKAAHALLLGDQVFSEGFAIRPEEFTSYQTKAAKAWRNEVRLSGKTPVTPDEMDMIRRMAIDANDHPAIKAGVLNGRAERSLIAKDPETGIWLKARPDIIPNGSGDFVDFKTTASLDEGFLTRQVFDACYYLQAGMLRKVCRLLDIQFTAFALLYCLKDEVADTAFVEMSEDDIDRGEFAITQCLKTIRRCLDENRWPGAEPFNAGGTPLRMKPWNAEQLDRWLDQETTGQLEAAE